MSLWGKIFGSESALNKTIDGVYNGLDAVVFTDEERAEMRLKIVDHVGDYMQKTSGQNLARRLIALLLIAQYLLFLNVAVGLGLFGYHEQAKFIWEVITESLAMPVNLIVGFYFFTQTVRGLKENKK